MTKWSELRLHDGGPCPVGEDEVVRCLVEAANEIYWNATQCVARDWKWSRIIAYQVALPEPRDMTPDEIKRLVAEATPGPWTLEDDNCIWFGNVLIAIVTDNAFNDYGQYFGDTDQGPANARLIAAAPDLAAQVVRLTEALEAIADPAKLPSYGDPTVLRDFARATLEDLK